MSTLPNALKHKEIIQCKPKGKYIGNDRCHVNCLSYALRHPNKVKSIVGVAQVFKNKDCIAHFIVQFMDGTYFDPTYGNMADVLYNYCVPLEYYDIATFVPNMELQNLKDYLFSLTPWYSRLFCKNPY